MVYKIFSINFSWLLKKINFQGVSKGKIKFKKYFLPLKRRAENSILSIYYLWTSSINEIFPSNLISQNRAASSSIDPVLLYFYIFLCLSFSVHPLWHVKKVKNYKNKVDCWWLMPCKSWISVKNQSCFIPLSSCWHIAMNWHTHEKYFENRWICEWFKIANK